MLDDRVEYTVRVRNSADCSGRVDIYGEYNDNDLEFISASHSGDEDTFMGETVVAWKNVFIDSNDSETFRARFDLTNTVEDGDIVELNVSAYDAGNNSNRYDRESEETRVNDSTNNGGSDNVDLDVQKKVSRSSEVIVGSSVSYTVTVKNNGTESAKNVVVTDTFGQGLVIAYANRAEQRGRSLHWNIGNLPAGGSETITYSLRATIPGQLYNSVLATSSNGNSASDSATITVLGVNHFPVTGTSFTRTISPEHTKVLSIHSSNETTNLPFAIWSTIITMGMTMGSVLGKRFLI